MIKEKFLKFLCWFKDHFSFLLEVVVRLVVGLDKEKNKPSDNEFDIEDDDVGKDKLP